ncbi:unnamed protein product [Closterium sp. NIES-53]
MTLRPSPAPQRVPLPSPSASSYSAGPDPLRAASPAVTCFLASTVTDPPFESTDASALLIELVDFAAAGRLDNATGLVAASASASVCPPSIGGECALSTDVLEDSQEEFECFAATVPHLVSMLLAPEGDPDALDIPTPRSYAEAIEWIFRVKRSPGSPHAFKARYVARGFSQRQGVDFFQTFCPTPKMTTLQVLLHVAAPRDYELYSLDFSTAFLQGSLHEEIWLCRPPGFTGSFPPGTQWSLRRPVYGLRQAPYDPVFATADTQALTDVKSELQKRHACIDLGELTSYLGLRITRDRAQRTITLTQSHMVQQVLQRFGFTYSSPQSTPLPTGHSLSAPPSDESVVPSDPYQELVGFLITSGMGLVLGGRARVVLTGHADASWVDDLATQRSSQGYTFILGFGSVSWRSTRSSSVLISSCEAEIYAGAMAAQELRWLTYLLTDLGEVPRSPPVLYVDNKAMIALCQEHRLEHRTKHIALHYFVARELQQRGQLRLAYVASQANTADVLTKALKPCDHQPCFAFLDWSLFRLHGTTFLRLAYVASQANTANVFTKALQPSCFAFLDWSCDLLFSPTLPMGGWEVLDMTDDKVVTLIDVIFYETLSLEVWKAKFGHASGQSLAHPPTDTTTTTVPLLAEVDELVDEDVVEVLPPPPVLAPPFPVADWPASTPVLATGDEGSLEASHVAPASGIAGGRTRRPPERLSFHTCLPPAAFTTVYDEADDDLLYDDSMEDEELVELDPDMHVDPEHRWYRALDGVLLGAGWKKSQVDEALYFKASDNGVTCWVLVYVDVLLATSSSPAMQKELKGLLEAAFKLREISPVVKYLGLEIVRDRPARKMWLHQQGYADKLRRRFMDDEQGGRVPKTPVSVDAYAELTFDNEEAVESEEEYRRMVGSLQFAATTTRPDIAFACSKLGSGLTVRSDQHWREVDRCLAYLADTGNTALEFGGGPESLELIGFVDADDVGDKQNRTSTGGYVFVYGGAAVSWSSSRIKCATLSSTQSKYVAATDAGKEGRRLRFLLAEFKLLGVGKPTILRVDNKSAITVAEGLGLTGNLKYMERRYAWLQHMVRRGKFVLKYIPTTEQPADFLTKALHFPAFNRCSVAISQVHLADIGDGDDDVQQ